MDLLEINPKGNFETWSPNTIKELKTNHIKSDLGQKLLYENAIVRIWEICLLPNERLPFAKVNYEFSWTAMTSGLLVSRYCDGRIFLIRFEKGDSHFFNEKEKPINYDLENKGDNIVYFQLTEFKNSELGSFKNIIHSSKRNIVN